MKSQLIAIVTAVLVAGSGPSVPGISIVDAADIGNIEAVKQHLAAGADVNVLSDAGETPLDYSVVSAISLDERLLLSGRATSRVEHIRSDTAALREQLANVIDVPTNSLANVPPDGAIAFEQPEIADLLSKHGGKTGEELKAEGK